MPVAREIARALAGPSSLSAMLPDFLRAQRWFGGKARPVRAVSVLDAVSFGAEEKSAFLFLVRVEYRDGAAETYSVPMIEAADVTAVPRTATGEAAPHLLVTAEGASLVLYDALRQPSFLASLLDAIREGRRVHGEHGEVRATNTPVLPELATQHLPPKLMRAEQSNTSVVYGDRLVFKLFRRVAEGVNPDVEIGRFLTEKTVFRNVPLLAGALEYVNDAGVCSSLGILQGFVHNQGDAWEFTLGGVGRYLASVPTDPSQSWAAAVDQHRSMLDVAADPMPQPARQMIGDFLASAELLGRRTAELHLALGSRADDPEFVPEPYSAADQHAFCQSALLLLDRTLQLLRRQAGSLPREVQEQARTLLSLAPELEQRFRAFEERPITALRTRIHGDYHLGQVLVVDAPDEQLHRPGGKDFIIIDFEGEPARSLEERRRKRSPLQDVAGMLRSFHYAAFAPLLGIGPESLPLPAYAPWASLWQTWVSAAFLREYFAVAGSAAFLPRRRQEIQALLNVHLLEKAVYELGYELNNRPSWVRVPLSGIEQLLGTFGERQATRRRIA